MLRYAISDRTLFPGHDRLRQDRLIQQATILAQEGIDYFQLRERDLDEDHLLALAVQVRDAIRCTGAPMQLVLNGPRQLAERAGVAWHGTANPGASNAHSLSCSVHTLDEVQQRRGRTSILLFAPVFGKTVANQSVQPGVGLQNLREAVQHANSTPVLALGGVTLQNASLCVAAGAAGIAGIRLFLR